MEFIVQGRVNGMQGTSSVVMDASTRDRRSGRQISGWAGMQRNGQMSEDKGRERWKVAKRIKCGEEERNRRRQKDRSRQSGGKEERQ